MTDDRVTISLGGEVSLADFDEAIRRFRSLLDALGEEVGGGADIRWYIDSLEAGSATATVRGVTSGLDSDRAMETIVHAYLSVGRALQAGQAIPYSNKIAQPAEQLRRLVGAKITHLTMAAAQEEVSILPAGIELPAVTEAPLTSFGAVEGRIQTVTNRGALKFTLYDLLDDRPVACYLSEGSEDIMRDAWGKLALVEGLVRRDPISGRPLSIRQVSRVVTRKPFERGSYRQARGALPSGKLDPRPEDVIRRLRDA